MISQEFTCKCGKQTGWIVDGEEMREPCPVCGRRYYGEYDPKRLQIRAVEIKLEHGCKFCAHLAVCVCDD